MFDKGIHQKSKSVWVFYAIAKKWALKEKKDKVFIPGAIPAYTLSELGEMLPMGNFSMQPVIKISNNLWTVPKNDNQKVSFETEVDARAFYIIRMLEKGEITRDQINGVNAKSNLVLSAQEHPVSDGNNLSHKTTIQSS
ncbi:MAG: hypothetical protein ACOYM0_01225 [Bacteroidales bacterium]